MPDESVRPLERGLAVLRALASAPYGDQVRAGDLVRATGLARSTVDRVVATLIRLGYVRQQGQELRLTPRLMELGNAYLAAAGLTPEVAARTARLADELDESVSLAVPDGDGARFVAQATRRRTMSVAFRIGDLLPAERCAPGALFAAGWDERQWAAWRTRRAADPEAHGFTAVPPRRVTESEFADLAGRAESSGWALDDQLIEPGLVAVSVPVPAPGGGVRCALSAVSHTSRHTAEALAKAVLPRLREEAAWLAEALERSHTTPPPAPSTHAATPAATDVAEQKGPSEGKPTQRGPEAVAPSVAHRTAAPAWSTASPADVARDAKAELGAGFLQSLARGLGVLRALGAAGGEGLPLTALAAATGLPRATARRCLITLEQEGYAAHDGRLFRPLPRILELGYARLSALSFAELAEPHLRDLVGRVHESASVTVLDGTDILYVARVPTVRIMSVHIAPGTRFPAYATAMGRVLLAGLPEAERARVLTAAQPWSLTEHTVTSVPALADIVRATAERGYAAIDEELEEGLRSVAVPVRDAYGRVIAALNVARHSGDTPLEATRDALLPALRETAAAIEADLHTAGRFNTVRVA
ncbi:IclR family transcriptional regulator domain-containing protein [Streptomyces himalayensis]|uniref:Helix-turn-helix domain-containing protein n=1 Tax=Streptomyces himalayensis subsp. himalayensis TaxID=2756131 RepID=A0A7W0IC74_9ACTN|nr:IclR family transcriptional regulator C-terminal domain-containing protein [Streptomyces himalayensis]MBA2949879.1 helix-turn-helix domain-containing protein [Streptomyces himalayensis subsp. himalayensis]